MDTNSPTALAVTKRLTFLARVGRRFSRLRNYAAALRASAIVGGIAIGGKGGGASRAGLF